MRLLTCDMCSAMCYTQNDLANHRREHVSDTFTTLQNNIQVQIATMLLEAELILTNTGEY